MATFHERITGNGEGVEIRRTGKPIRYWALRGRDDPEPYGVLAVGGYDLLPRIFVPGMGLVDIPSAADWVNNGEHGAHQISEAEALQLMRKGVCRISRESVQRLKGNAPAIWPPGLDYPNPGNSDTAQDADDSQDRPPKQRGVALPSMQTKHYVAGPQGRPPTEEEALEMGRALFDAIQAERRAARDQGADADQ